jgi:hypothetical protein
MQTPYLFVMASSSKRPGEPVVRWVLWPARRRYDVTPTGASTRSASSTSRIA